MIWIGTSGYNYTEWKGSFYPRDLPASKMLPYYADRFTTVEINYTFYRMPTEKVTTSWAGSTPSGFRFALKASRRITHQARLRDCESMVDSFMTRARGLGPKLGPVLFQLPPYFRKDVAVLGAFLETVPPDTRAAFEFRHSSWHSDDVYELLKASNVALCITDSEKMTTPLVATAGHGYFRLRDERYQEADIARWGDTIASTAESSQDVFVYFKHEDEGKGPEFAKLLEKHLGLG